MGYKRLFDPVPVAALGGTRICYYRHPEIGYIELLE
jgi:methylmalonyl-CoA/ethylmalonyl-CoA epimerase